VTYEELQPRNPLHLRKWLTAKSGYVNRTIVEPPDEIVCENEKARKQALDWLSRAILAVRQSYGQEDYTWIRRHGNSLVVFVPMSLAFEEMDHNEFGALNDDVSKRLNEIIGLDGDELLNRQKEVA